MRLARAGRRVRLAIVVEYQAWAKSHARLRPLYDLGFDFGAPPVSQSSRYTRSRRSCRSCASTDKVAIGRASSRLIEIGSPVSSQ